MAQIRLRPSTWKLKNTTGNKASFRLDYELIDVDGNSEIEVQALRMVSFDDSVFSAFRSAPSPQTPSGNVGSVLDSSGQSISGEINPYITPEKK